MPLIAAAFLAGMLVAAHAPAPAPGWILGGALVIGLIASLQARARVAAAILLGAAWFSLHAAWQLADGLPASEDRLEVSGEFLIEDFPRRRGRAMTFLARPADASLPARVRLNWYETEHSPRIGERWQFTVVLRTPRGLVNPGGFDYERWLFTRGIGATGYVRGGASRIAGPGMLEVSWWRDRLESRISALLPPSRERGVMVALATGSRHRLDTAAAELFQATGTSHLMAISGLHVGLVAGLAFLLAGRLAGRIPGVSNGRDAAALFALAAAITYGLLAGFGTPVRRALLMLATLTLAGRWRRPIAPATGLSLALIVVLAVQPLDCLTPGFALSFGAVAAILAIGGRSAATGRRQGPAGLIGLQVRLWFLLIPLTLLLFDRLAWTAIPANLLAIPAFGFFVVPATLAGGVLAQAGTLPAEWLLGLTHAGLGLLLRALEWLAGLPGARFLPAGRGHLVALLLSAAALTVILPRYLPGRWVPGWLAIALFLWRSVPLPERCLQADVLDVGQGLAVVLRTRRHALLYDAGPAYASGSDAGARVVVPALRALGVGRLDVMMLSHADADHAGGAKSVRRAVPVGGVLSGEAGELSGLQARACQRGEHWSWDGVDFRVLWPAGPGEEGNDASCVLEVRVGAQRLLLPGDIERRGERALLAAGGLSPVDVVLMPHHGSATSSTAGFTRALRPRLAIATAAWRNRWNFPRPEVVARWQAVGAEVLATGDTGAITLTFCADSEAPAVTALRAERRRIWSPRPAVQVSGTHPL